MKDNEWRFLLTQINSGSNVIIAGKKGSGKTFWINKIRKKLGEYSSKKIIYAQNLAHVKDAQKGNIVIIDDVLPEMCEDVINAVDNGIQIILSTDKFDEMKPLRKNLEKFLPINLFEPEGPHETMNACMEEIEKLVKCFSVNISKEKIYEIFSKSYVNKIRFNLASPGACMLGLKNILVVTSNNNHRYVENEDILIGLFGQGYFRTDLNSEKAEKVAIHEAGHYIVTRELYTKGYTNTAPILASCVFCEDFNGVVSTYNENEENTDLNMIGMKSDIAISLAGEAATRCIFSIKRNGASEDLRVATILSRQLIAEKSMGGKELNDISMFTKLEHASDKKRIEIETEIQNVLDECYKVALSIVKKNIDNIRLIALNLQKKGILNAKEIEEILTNKS